MAEIDLKKFHDRLADLMQEIHLLCIKHGIQYTMMGGTLIGALRHQGFIPWDDDIDIGMTWNNYLKFQKIAFQLNHPWVEFRLAGKTLDYYNPFIKAYDSRTTFIEGNGQKPGGIFIDIFPIVKAGDSKEKAIEEYRKHRFYQSLLKRKGYTFSTGAVREWILHFAARFFTTNQLMKKIYKHYHQVNSKYTKFISDMDGTLNGIVPAYLFEEYKLYNFEKYEFMGITKADEYLTLDFGDYMQLPPIEKRIPHHIHYINLELPYKEYKS